MGCQIDSPLQSPKHNRLSASQYQEIIDNYLKRGMHVQKGMWLGHLSRTGHRNTHQLI